MLISDKGLNLIKNSEGFSAKAYICPAGYLTIGYGHRVLENEVAIYKTTLLSTQQAETLLQTDLEACYRAISNMVLVPLAQGQFDALCSFIFNLGATKFFNSTMRKLLNRGNYAGAALEFPKWVYAKDKNGKSIQLPGLIARRNAEKELFFNV